MVLEKQVDLEKIEKLENTNLMRDELLKLDGVGPKVADCILLFALKKIRCISNWCMGKKSNEWFIYS